MNQSSFWQNLLPHLRWLGYGGLLPFASFALGAALLPNETHQTLSLLMLRVYGLSIVSFIGAISWGLAIATPELTDQERRSLLYWSVVPSLLGCASFLLPSSGACLTLAVIAALALAVDLRTAVQLKLPASWRILRLHLSLGAIASLGAGAYVAHISGR
jgi:hypothetical protein